MNGQYQRQQHGRNQNRHGNKNSGHGGDDSLPTFQSKWITEGADDKMIEFVEKLGKKLKEHGISASQLRNIYGEIMRIKLKGFEELKTDFKLLKPKLAYNGAKLSKDSQKKFFKTAFIEEAFVPAYNKVEDEKTFENFQKFFEAILAYHKYFENVKN